MKVLVVAPYFSHLVGNFNRATRRNHDADVPANDDITMMKDIQGNNFKVNTTDTTQVKVNNSYTLWI